MPLPSEPFFANPKFTQAFLAQIKASAQIPRWRSTISGPVRFCDYRHGQQLAVFEHPLEGLCGQVESRSDTGFLDRERRRRARQRTRSPQNSLHWRCYILRMYSAIHFAAPASKETGGAKGWRIMRRCAFTKRTSRRTGWGGPSWFRELTAAARTLR